MKKYYGIFMKHIAYLIILLSSFNILFAEDIVLKYYSDKDELTYFVSSTTGFPYTHQFQRFDIQAPVYIKSMAVYLYGESSNVKVYLLDHQAGSSIPQFFAYSGKGVLGVSEFQFAGAESPQRIAINFPDPVYFDGDQLFIGVFIENIQKTFFISTKTQMNPFCQSTDGGNYLFQYLANYNATEQAGLWASGGFAYLADLTVEYAHPNAISFLLDRTVTKGIPQGLAQNSIAWGDINNDDYLDLLVNGKLFLNSPQKFSDITTNAGLSGSPGNNAFIDMNNDGNLDILFIYNSSDGKKPMEIYMNNGDKTFTKNIVGLPGFRDVSSFAIGDVNNDNYPDLFLTQLWSPYPVAFPNYFYLNNKSNSFILKNGVCQTSPARRSRGSQFVDFDDDGDLDLYVANYYQETDELWENKGDLVFVDIIANKGIDKFTIDGKDNSNHGTGVDWYDYNNDGDIDLLLPQFAHPANAAFGFRGTTIYKNEAGKFTDTYNSELSASEIGITYEETHAGGAWGDYDNDGLADFIITTYYGCRYVDLYKQNEDHTFKNSTFVSGLNRIVSGDDACWADFDNDGKLDLAMSINRKFSLFKNYYETTNNNWVELDLINYNGLKVPIGAKVKVYANGNVYTQEVVAGRGQRMQKPSRLHFGIGNANEIEKVKVRWSGETEYVEYDDIEINKINKITNGENSVETGEVNNYSISVYADKKSNIIKVDYTAKDLALHLDIYDINGAIIYSENISNTNFNTNTIVINSLNLSNGKYFVKLVGNKTQLNSQFNWIE